MTTDAPGASCHAACLELTPFRGDEIGAAVGGDAAANSRLWLRVGFSRSFLAADDARPAATGRDQSGRDAAALLAHTAVGRYLDLLVDALMPRRIES